MEHPLISFSIRLPKMDDNLWRKQKLIPNDTLKGSFRKYSGCIAHATLTAPLPNGLGRGAAANGHD
jgi:hypothetical protein